MIHLREPETTNISSHNDCVVFALVGVVDELQDMLKKLGIGDDD